MGAIIRQPGLPCRRERVRLATTRNIRALKLTGLPVLSVPCGFHRDGLPIGLRVVGPAFGDNQILRIGRAYAQAIGWHLRAPAKARDRSSGKDRGGPVSR